jgi:serine/threonine-protein kinase HipA
VSLDRLSVSLAFAPDERVPVGTLSQSGRDSLFQFDESFLAAPLPLSPLRLPVRPGVQAYDGRGGMETFGVFEDALPDGWGRRIVDARFRARHGRLPTLLERFASLGGDGMGALVFEPADPAAAPGAAEDFRLDALARNAWDFDGGRINEVLPALRRAAGSSGGARPKANVSLDPATGEVRAPGDPVPDGFEPWIVKFNTRAEGPRAGALEYAYARLAADAGAQVAPCRLVETRAGRFFATRRFDRAPGSRRLHLHSAAGLLHADFRVAGDEYAVLFRLAAALLRDAAARRELFLRACLNVLLHNRDDHLKNFSFLMDARGRWTLAPFYDFTFADGPGGWQTLSVAGEGANPGPDDLLRLAAEVDLPRADALDALERARAALAALPSLCRDLAIPLPRL